MNYQELKQGIEAVIKRNNNREITGPILQGELLKMIDELGAGSLFMGVATTQTVPPSTSDSKIFYIACQTGNYPKFNLSVGEREIGIFLYKDGAWVKEAVKETGTISAEELQEIINVLND